MVRYIQRLLQHPLLLVSVAILLLCLSTILTYHYTHTTIPLTSVPNAYAQALRSEREIFNKVYNLAANRLQTDAWAQPAQPLFTEVEILNKVYDPAGQFLRTSAGGGGTSQAWADITSGTNVNNLTMGTGGTLTTSGTGVNNANQFKGNTVIPVVDGGTGLTSAVDDAIPVGNGTIYQLKVLPNCVDTVGQHLNYTAATNTISCGTSGTGGGGAPPFDTITSGTNNSAIMTIASGAQITTTAGGINNANQFKGNTLIAPADGGTGITTPVNNSVMVGDGAAWLGKVLPDCDDTLGQHINFDSTTKNFTCGTSGGGGGGGSFSALSSGTNTTAAMVCGSGCSIDVTGTGTNKATQVGTLLPEHIVTLTNNVKVSGKQNVPRTVTQVITTNAFTINVDTTDIADVPALTGNVTVNVSAGTSGNPEPYQDIDIVFAPTATPYSITWSSAFAESVGMTLPTSTTGDGVKYDMVKVRRFAGVSKWVVIAKTTGVEPGITTLTSSATYNCPHTTSRSCEMDMTGTAGTVTIAIPSGGTPANGKQLVLKIKCTNLQTITMTGGAGGFISSPNVPITGITCPAAGPSWTAMAVEYSTVLTAWQLYASN